MMVREIVVIDEEKCNGCGLCIPNCHEGALRVIDGKARLISELMCDGLGACIGYCPEDAIAIERREAEAYNEETVISQMIKSGKNTVFAHLKHLQEHNETIYLKQATSWLKANREILPFSIGEVHELLHGETDRSVILEAPGCGCAGSAPQSFTAPAGFRMSTVSGTALLTSELTQWPVQMHLINPAASYFQHADLLVAADCVAFSHGDFHRTFLTGKKLVIACPKLDQSKETYIRKLISLVDEAKVNTITVVIMEVPCCGGLVQMVQEAVASANRKVPVKAVVVSIKGEILEDNWI
jgi:NAD-dependent dihydropyrimidine dehydrogenase PreA subunit